MWLVLRQSQGRLRVMLSQCAPFVAKSCNRNNKVVLQFHKISMSTATSSYLSKPAKLAVEIFRTALDSVKPAQLLKDKFVLKSASKLFIKDGAGVGTTWDLNRFDNIFVVGFGKAVLPMAEYVMATLGDKVKRCIINVPEEFRVSTVKRIEVNRGAKDNIPDVNAVEGTMKIVKLLESCSAGDLVIVLITGGGSALLEYPRPPITIHEYGSLVKILSRAGATIEELNGVRKHLSVVKGGGLINICNSSTILSLILSDVLGDPIDIIASGPTVPNVDQEASAKSIMEKYVVLEDLPSSIQQVLSSPSPPLAIKDVTNLMIGSNSVCLDSASRTAKLLNLYPVILTNTLCGEASDVGKILAQITGSVASILCRFNNDRKALINALESLKIPCDLLTFLDDNYETLQKQDGICLLLGGETTVTVQGKGIGGRNQELALSAAIALDELSKNAMLDGNVALLSAGTDGYDGPCDAAGAVIDPTTIRNCPLSAADYLHDNNSYNYFKQNSNGVYHIITGHTETNVMDLIVIVILKSKQRL